MKTLNVFYFICLLLFLSSCSFFAKKQQDSTVIDTIIDFTSVDTYPLFANCKDIVDIKNKNCFQSEVYKRISNLLQSQPLLHTNKIIQDTVLLKLKIDKKGKIHLVTTKNNSLTQTKFKKIDSILHLELQKIPQLQPATKRGIPVTTVFTLPLILTNGSSSY